MSITIEQIRKLNAERTQGEWVLSDEDYTTIITEETLDTVAVDVPESGDKEFILAAPAIAELAIQQAEKIERLNRIIRCVETKAGWRFQACDFMREGDEGYSIVSDVCIKATEYLREIGSFIRQALNNTKE